jgi:D-glycero-D-manno-heptose 1,7-bisphosphate phosphatase
MSLPVIFLDKDGTLLQNVPYNVDPNYMRLMDGAVPAISYLAKAGFSFVVISNQPGIALGKFSEEKMKTVHAKLKELMRDLGASLLNFYYCPHHPEGIVRQYRKVCRCRKPEPGLIDQAMTDYDIDINSSWLIGDILDDIEAGNRRSIPSILLNNGNETIWQKGEFRIPSKIVNNLNEAADHILLEKAVR